MKIGERWYPLKLLHVYIKQIKERRSEYMNLTDN